MSKCAVVLVGGQGQRLRPFTVVLPKPLMPVGDLPILEIVIRQLVKSGFTRVVLAVNHLAHLIESFFGDGSTWGITIEYSREPRPLGTMGPLRLISNLPETFVVMNGDVLCDVDIARFLDQHTASGTDFSILSTIRHQAFDYGVLETNSSGTLTGFQEKPFHQVEVSTGIYALKRTVIDVIPPDTQFGFDQLMLDCLQKGISVRVVRHEGYWLDIGRPDDYAQAVSDMTENPGRFLA